jgi:hypothetical protein
MWCRGAGVGSSALVPGGGTRAQPAMSAGVAITDLWRKPAIAAKPVAPPEGDATG